MTRARWPAHGASSSSIRSSVPRGAPVSANATTFDRWASPTLTASGSPSARVRHLGRGPWPDPDVRAKRRGQGGRARAAAARQACGRRERLEAAGLPRDSPQERAAPGLDAQPGQRPRRERGDRGRRRRHEQAQRARRRGAVRPDEPPIVAPRLRPGDPLLEHRRQERLPHRAGATQPDATEAARQPGDDRVEARVEARVVVIEAERRGQAIQQQPGAGPPGPGPDRRALDPDLDGGRPVRRSAEAQIAAPAATRIVGSPRALEPAGRGRSAGPAAPRGGSSASPPARPDSGRACDCNRAARRAAVRVASPPQGVLG